MRTRSAHATHSNRGRLIAAVVLLSGLVIGGPAKAETPGGGYKLAPEDVLMISVWKEEGLEREVLVRPDGRLSFPLVGHMQAAGRTPEQVQAEIEKRLEEYIPEPVVTVSVVSVAGNKIYVIGKVNKPGMYPVGRPTDVMQALSLAGGLNPFAKTDEIRILRRENGRQVILPFDYEEVADGENLEQNILLRAGDTVVVQ